MFFVQLFNVFQIQIAYIKKVSCDFALPIGSVYLYKSCRNIKLEY